MSEFKVASRYAKALLGLADEQQAVEHVKADMEAFIALVKGNAEFKAVLANPIVPIGKKAAILKQLFDGKVHKMVLEFFKIMAYKGRAGILLATAIEFVRQYNVYQNIVLATVTSAIPLSKEAKAELEEKIAKAYSAEVKLENAIDPTLIGGFVLKVGDEQLDASIAGKLNRLGSDFRTNPVNV